MINSSRMCSILEEFQRVEIALPAGPLSEFMTINDLGLPTSLLVAYGLVELTPSGEKLIEETWLAFCNMLGIPHDFDYENYQDCLRRVSWLR